MRRTDPSIARSKLECPQPRCWRPPAHAGPHARFASTWLLRPYLYGDDLGARQLPEQKFSRHAIGEGIAPENLIHGQLADEILLGTILVITGDADDQVPDVIIRFASSH